jgi:hypothetical protein
MHLMHFVYPDDKVVDNRRIYLYMWKVLDVIIIVFVKLFFKFVMKV